MTVLVVDDLFVAGIGLDIVGAYLLGRGVVASPATIMRRSRAHWNLSPPLLVDQAEARADGRAGFAVLGAGFGVQALGYVLSLGLSAGDPGSGWARAGIAVACGVAAAALAWTTWRLTRIRRLKRQLVELARIDLDSGQRHAKPAANLLCMLGQACDWPLTLAELGLDGNELYCRRVFGVTDTWSDPRLKGPQ